MKLVTWNILAQTTIPEDLQTSLSWKTRLPAILNYLKSIDADFICLQEVELNTFETDFKTLLSDYQYERHAVCLIGKHKRTNTFGNATLWKKGILKKVSLGSRSLHVLLQLTEKHELCISNVHFPAKNGLEGYFEKRKQLASAAQKWNTLNVIVAGDYNDSLSYLDENGSHAGLYNDFTCLGFVISSEEYKKQTCKSFRGNIHNLDHALSRASILTKYIPQDLDVTSIPSSFIPSDHLPVLYEVSIDETFATQKA